MTSSAASSPFLAVSSFEAESSADDEAEVSPPTSTPFLSVYEAGDDGEAADPEAEQFASFVNELDDEEFNDAIFRLAGEAADVAAHHGGGFDSETGATAERIVRRHLDPVGRAADGLIAELSAEFGDRDPTGIDAGEIDSFVDNYAPADLLSPASENFLGGLKNAFKSVAGKAVNLAKKGISAAAKLGLGPILAKLRGLVNPLIERVLKAAIGKLPAALQPMARTLAQKLGFAKELEAEDALDSESAAAGDVAANIQTEFNAQLAGLLYAPSQVDQEFESARYRSNAESPADLDMDELDAARGRLIDGLAGLREGEDPSPHVEQFLPAVLPVLKLGLKLAGRKRVVDFLAKLVAKLISRFLGPQQAMALSQAIVNSGLRLINLEAGERQEAESNNAAMAAVAATVEETFRRIAALPEDVLDDPELLEGHAVAAFEQAAAANLPPVLSKDAYRKRPDLIESSAMAGTWVPMPLGSRRTRAKKFSRIVRLRLTPHKAKAVSSFAGEPLSEYLEEQLGLPAGETFEARVHLYETVPGRTLADVAQSDRETAGLATPNGFEQLHPLTTEAAGVLLGEPSLGREVDPQRLAGPHAAEPGQRFYYLEIPGKRPLAEPGAGGKMRRRTRVRLVLDLSGNQIKVHLFLSEVRAQELAVKLRQKSHLGTVTALLGSYLEKGMRSALTGGYGRLKVIHPAAVPGRGIEALRRLPALVPQMLLRKLREWTTKSLAEHLRTQADKFIAATEEPAEGVTITFTVAGPPGLTAIAKAIGGGSLSLADLSLAGAGGGPKLDVKVSAGYAQ